MNLPFAFVSPNTPARKSGHLCTKSCVCCSYICDGQCYVSTLLVYSPQMVHHTLTTIFLLRNFALETLISYLYVQVISLNNLDGPGSVH